MRVDKTELVLIAMTLALIATRARAETMIRTVPDGAVLSYSVAGRVVQEIPLRAGTYRITVEEMATRAGHRPLPKREAR